MFDCDDYLSYGRYESLPPSPIYDRYQSGNGYHVIPPSYKGTFMPPKPDLVFNNAHNDVETDHTAFHVKLSPTKPDHDLSHTNRPSAPIIKNWVSDSEDESETKAPQKIVTIMKKMAQLTVRNHAHRGNHKQYAQMTFSNPQRHVVPAAVLTQSKFVPINVVPINVVRPVSTAVPKLKVTRPRQHKPIVTKPNSPTRRHITCSPSPKISNSPPRVTVVQAPVGNPQHALKDKGVIDGGCSRRMTGNMSYLSDFEELNGGYVAFGGNPQGDEISGKGKFNGKVDEGILYSISSKAFRVFDSRTRIVQETLHVNFLENKPNVAGSGPTWLFDIDTLTKTMNYQPVTADNQSNPSAGFQDNFNAEKTGEEIKQQYVLFPVKKPESGVNVSPSSSAQSKKHNDKTKKEAKDKSLVESLTGYRNLSAEFEDFSDNGINEVNAAGTLVPAVRQISLNSTNTFNAGELEEITYSDDEDDVGAEADFNNLETSITVSPIPTTRVHKDHHSAFLYGTIEKEVYVCQPLGFEDSDYPDKVYKVVKALYGLHQAPRAWYETLANYLLENGFQRGKIDQTLFIKRQKGDILLVQIYVDDIIFGSTNKDLSMIGLLMYLTSSRPDNMFAVCACACFQVTPKASHLHAVKRIFRYLKGKPHLGLWYPKDLAFELVAYSDSDYAGASLDRKSTTGGCQFLGYRLISWQCKKQIVMATSSTEAEYVATARQTATGKEISNLFMAGSLPKTKLLTFIHVACLLHVNDVTRLQALVDKNKVVVTEATIRDVLRLDDAEGVECLPNEEIFAELARMSYKKPSTKLTFYKAFFSSQWKFFIHTILQCMSAKRTSWNEFGSSIASAVICLSSAQEVEERDAEVNVEDVNTGDATEGDVTLTRRVEHLKLDKIAQALEITKLKRRVKKLEKRNKVKVLKLRRLKRVGSAQRIDTSDDTIMDDLSNQGRMIVDMDEDVDVVLEEAKDVNDDVAADNAKVVQVANVKDNKVADVEDNADIQGRIAESEAKIYKIDMDHANKVLSMQEEESEPAELQEVVDIVTTAKIITEVVTAASTTITTDDVPIPTATTAAAPTLIAAPSRRRKGVVIRDPEESTTTSTMVHSEAKSRDKGKGILVEEPKPLKKQAQIEQDEKYARELEAELNKTID
nr:putative reverse transcriptase, RNA-dependent DNA polymerase [Tanacetum cinerariifolium]